MKAVLTGIVMLLTMFGNGRAMADDLLVFAASSLREPFIEIGQAYKYRTGREITFNFSGSQALRTQIEFGAPADLYAAANPEIIRPLVEKKLVETVHYLAGNRLIVLLAEDAAGINSLEDLRRPGLQIAIGNRHVPIGKYTRLLLAGMANDPQFGPALVEDLRRNVRTEESSVKSIVAKVVLGEVDAGIVYRTDLTANVRRKTSYLELPFQHNPLVLYPAAVVSGSTQSAISRDFLEYLLSAASRKIFDQHGFLPAEPGNAIGRTK